MSLFTSILKFAVLVFMLNVLIRQTYNFVFLFGKRPLTWIAIIGLLGFGIVAMWGILGWSHGVVGWACLVALVTNIPQRGGGKTEREEAAIYVSEFYSEMGIAHGHLKYRLGLTAFAVGAVAAWTLFYSELCAASGEACTPIYRLLIGSAGG